MVNVLNAAHLGGPNHQTRLVARYALAFPNDFPIGASVFACEVVSYRDACD